MSKKQSNNPPDEVVELIPEVTEQELALHVADRDDVWVDDKDDMDLNEAAEQLAEQLIADFQIDMKGIVDNPSTGKGGFEDKDARIERMSLLLKSEKVFLKIGKLMSLPYRGRTVAVHVLSGGSLALPNKLTVNGFTFDLAPGQMLSLDSIDSWGCPGCGSQHGTGVRPSPRRNAAALADVVFYLAPTTRMIFSVSATCWGSYVKALGFAKKFQAPKGVTGGVR